MYLESTVHRKIAAASPSMLKTEQNRTLKGLALRALMKHFFFFLNRLASITSYTVSKVLADFSECDYMWRNI